MQKLCRFVVACLIGATVLSCGGGGDGPAAPVPVLTILSASFPTGTIQVGQMAAATASGLDQFGAAISTGTISWSTANTAVATVNSSGVVTGVGAGQTNVIANAGGKQGQALVTVTPVPVASVIVSPASASVGVGATQQLTASTLDASGNVLSGRVVTWQSSDETKATVSSAGLVTGVAGGPATITATSEGRSGTSQITVGGPPGCNSATALQLALGGIRTLSAAEIASLCLGGSASATEYVLIPYNSTNVADIRINLQITATNTSAIDPGSQVSLQPGANIPTLLNVSATKSVERSFRERERRDLAPVFASHRKLRGRLRGARQLPAGVSPDLTPSTILGMPATPLVGETYQVNTNIIGNTCTSAKQLQGAEVIAVLPHTIVLADVTRPTGGYTNAEMSGFGDAFEAQAYPMDVENFGAPSDMDNNGRVIILFTPGVNAFPTAPGSIVGGLFAARDLFLSSGSSPNGICPASNEGEMFYMPVPDPNNTINTNYTNKDNLARVNLGVLAHEFQHLINAGRRIYVNNASSFEEVWLNEGLSHMAEELLYYRISGNSTRANIDLTLLRSSPAQLDAVNAYQVNNLARARNYMKSPEVNSPFAGNDAIETRGATWQLLRYSADRKGGLHQTTWFSLVNSTQAGQANFNAVFGDIITMQRDMVVAQFTDDANLGVAANFTHPSWNYRSILPAINSNVFPLLARALLGSPLDITLNGGGAAYVRFHVAANVPASIGATSSGAAVPAAVNFILVRTQ